MAWFVSVRGIDSTILSFREESVALKRIWRLLEADDADQEVFHGWLAMLLLFIGNIPRRLNYISFVAIILSKVMCCLFHSFRLGFLIVCNAMCSLIFYRFLCAYFSLMFMPP